MIKLETGNIMCNKNFFDDKIEENQQLLGNLLVEFTT